VTLSPLDSYAVSSSALVPPRYFATPRRLAVLIQGVHDHAPDVQSETSGPPVGAKPEAVNWIRKEIWLDGRRIEKAADSERGSLRSPLRHQGCNT